MILPKKYLLDANVFIEAKRRYYSFKICPGFWECLEKHNADGSLQSIDRVKDELVAGNDDLKDWVVDCIDPSLFDSSSQSDTISCYSDMVRWVYSQDQFTSAAKDEFSAISDGWLIAHAKANDLVLVTHEVYNPSIKRKVPMPNVCQAFDVNYVDTFQMLSTLKTSFVLATQPKSPNLPHPQLI